ncbi:hypothetical protein [Pseudophaeobacter sp.]|uniref:hypothetical protein n=1 Tax=Pseudophaeobacter sp. TaxID=1971739 RepID=UPI003A987EAF
MTTTKIDDHVAKILEKIRSGKYDAPGLTNLFTNATKYPGITEAQREELVRAIEERMRIDHPRHATRHLGPANRKTLELMQDYFSDLTSRFDFSANMHKNKVKLGGNVISGEAVIHDYISYRSPQNDMICSIAFHKTNHGDPLELRVTKHPAGSPDRNCEAYKQLPGSSLDEATQIFEEYLSGVLFN